MDNDLDCLNCDIITLSNYYWNGDFTPEDIVRKIYGRMTTQSGNNIWIYLRELEEVLEYVKTLGGRGPSDLPLYGIPFAVKDNIDVAGIPTTAACQEYSYLPVKSAPVVERLLDAGAILIGKTNMDQFATGLDGTRSPYGICHNAFDERYIAGGSSSGSAVAVAAGLVSFALGTDTGGSGRVPAALSNIVGLKPTRGLLSARGVVPACRSLDCVSIFALTAQDAMRIFCAIEEFDSEDIFARHDRHQIHKHVTTFNFGVPLPEQLDFYGDQDASALFKAAKKRLKAIGGRSVVVDISPFLEAQKLLYGGPWLAERYLEISNFLRMQAQALHPVTLEIISQGADITASDYFEAYYRLKALIRQAEQTWEQIDMLLLPTVGTVFTISQILQDPFHINSQIGRYTSFVNLMDLSAIALPMGFREDGLPLGISLISPALHDQWLAAVGMRYQAALGGTLGISDRLYYNR